MLKSVKTYAVPAAFACLLQLEWCLSCHNNAGELHTSFTASVPQHSVEHFYLLCNDTQAVVYSTSMDDRGRLHPEQLPT